ncbi:hypothetical protein BD779DRAFT_1677982 [Infundibulicybe gibba]|nr:hypothetical protein BD779DRAFT_1677982 [Infundibulicybe gibba]
MDPDLSLFFSLITLPSLRILEVRFGYPGRDYSSDDGGIDDQSELAPIISGFFERSSTHLSKLNLIDIPFSPRGLIKCLSFVPSLVALDICFNGQWHGIDDEILRRLNANHSQYILPRIRSLSLRGLGAFSEELLDALVTSRRDISPTNDQVSLLENLTLDCSTPQSNSTSRLPRFQRFTSEGLNITYGEDWHIYNSIQAANSKPLAQGQAEIAASLGRTYFSGKVELSDPS